MLSAKSLFVVMRFPSAPHEDSVIKTLYAANVDISDRWVRYSLLIGRLSQSQSSDWFRDLWRPHKLQKPRSYFNYQPVIKHPRLGGETDRDINECLDDVLALVNEEEAGEDRWVDLQRVLKQWWAGAWWPVLLITPQPLIIIIITVLTQSTEIILNQDSDNNIDDPDA